MATKQPQHHRNERNAADYEVDCGGDLDREGDQQEKGAAPDQELVLADFHDEAAEAEHLPRAVAEMRDNLAQPPVDADQRPDGEAKQDDDADQGTGDGDLQPEEVHLAKIGTAVAVG